MSGELPKTQHEKVPLLKNSPDVDTNISQKSDDVNTSISKNSNNDTKLSIKLSKFYDSAQNAEMLGGVTRTTNIINDKDGRNNQTWWTLLKNGVNVDSRKETFCDDLGRKTSSSLYTIERDSSGNLVNSTQNILLNTTYSYIDLPLYKTSGQVFAVNMRNNSGFSKLLTYQYDELGNISKANDVSYVYDEAGQLTRVNDPANGTIVYNYDVGGNITSKVTYAYTEGTLGTPLSTISYGYDTTWRDLLTSYNGNTITYDNIGNPLSYYNGLTFTWQMGRQLAGVSGNSNTISYRYDENGIRTSKTVNGTTTEFTLVGDKITYQTDGTNSLYFRYDGDDKLIGFELNGVDYYYVRNLQDDIIAILDNTGACVVEYTYDAWGKLLTTTGSMASTVGVINPFRYRGYYYDTETSLYYLQSRYYDANTGRFLNSDDTALLLATQGEMLGANLFVYCANNPVINCDPTGMWYSFTFINDKYNRANCLIYARKWYNSRNKMFFSYTYDCANFVSQCLYAGGLNMYPFWHSYKLRSINIFESTRLYGVGKYFLNYSYRNDWDVTSTWSCADVQYQHFKNQYFVSKVITISNLSDLQNAVKYGKIRLGDLIYFDDDGNGTPNHAGIINNVDAKMIYYAGHTQERFNQPLDTYIKNNSSHKVYILCISK